MATRPEPSTADPLERASATEIADAVSAWLDALEPAQRARATFPFETDERFAWAYTPGDRNGLPIAAMSVGQREAATATLDAALSIRGAREVRAIMALEEVLGQVERDAGWLDAPRRDPELYWFSVFGDPGGPEPWALRINGHHVAIVLTMAGGEVISAAPSFLGANPATIPGGPRAGERTIDGEETLARALLASLSAEQRAIAVVDPVAPPDIRSGNGRRAELRGVPDGIPYERLETAQREGLERLIRHYLERARPDIAEGRMGAHSSRRSAARHVRVGRVRTCRAAATTTRSTGRPSSSSTTTRRTAGTTSTRSGAT